MKAITVSDRDAGVAGLSLTDLPYPQPATTTSSSVYTPRVSHPVSLTGRTPGPTARVITGHLRHRGVVPRPARCATRRGQQPSAATEPSHPQ
jgi:hypothetical protein